MNPKFNNDNRFKDNPNLKEFISHIRSCFSITTHERLIILLLLALFLSGLALRWWHLSHARADKYEYPIQK